MSKRITITVPADPDQDDCLSAAAEDYIDSIEINIYRSAGSWYAARWIDGEYDGCDELDVAGDVTEDEARHEALTMPLLVAGPRLIRRVADGGAL